MSGLEPAPERLDVVLPPDGAPRRSRRMLVVVNPHATTMSDRLRDIVLAALQDRYAVDTVQTTHRGHAIELCRDAARDRYDVVAAFGGDGTVNEAANGLAGTDTALTCLPGGSNNVFCRMLGMPTDVVDATAHLLDRAAAPPRRVDLARLNDRWFTFSAGIGLDASVVARVDAHPERKRRFGPWYFAASGITTFLRRYVVHPPVLQAEVAGTRLRGVSAMVQNGRPYTYFRGRPIDLADGATLASGDLAGVVLTRASAVDMPTVIWRAFSSRARMTDHRRVAAFAGASELVVRVLDGRPVPVQVDGDHVGDALEARFGVAPAALAVLA